MFECVNLFIFPSAKLLAWPGQALGEWGCGPLLVTMRRAELLALCE